MKLMNIFLTFLKLNIIHKSVNKVKIEDISADIHGYVYINKKDNPLSTSINIGTSIISFINLFKSEEYNYANELNELNHSKQQNIGKQVLMSKEINLPVCVKDV